MLGVLLGSAAAVGGGGFPTQQFVDLRWIVWPEKARLRGPLVESDPALCAAVVSVLAMTPCFTGAPGFVVGLAWNVRIGENPSAKTTPAPSVRSASAKVGRSARYCGLPGDIFDPGDYHAQKRRRK